MQYAAWGVDYLKYDWCNLVAKGQNAEASYTLMSKALQSSGRPIVFSLCEWGSNQPWLWAKDVGNLWRTTGDIVDKWTGSEKWGGLGVVQIIDLNATAVLLCRARDTGTTPTCSKWATAV